MDFTNAGLVRFVKTYGAITGIVLAVMFFVGQYAISSVQPSEERTVDCSLGDLRIGNYVDLDGKGFVVSDLNDFLDYDGTYRLQLSKTN